MCVCKLTAAVLAAVLVSAMTTSVLAAEIDVVGAGALQWWAEDVIPDFQRTTSHTVKSTFQVISGDAELGVAVTSETIHAPGVELVGLIPAEVQSLIVYTAVIPRQAREPIAAKALIDFLTSPTAVSRLKASGLIEP